MNTFTPKGTMARVIVALSTAVVLAATGAVFPQIASAVTAEELAAKAQVYGVLLLLVVRVLSAQRV